MDDLYEEIVRIRSEGGSASIAPIGLDIHAKTPEEIAESIMSEIILVRREKGPSGTKTWEV